MSLDVALSVASSDEDSEAGDLVSLGKCTQRFALSAAWILWFHSFLGVIVQCIAVTASVLCVTKGDLSQSASSILIKVN